MGVISLGPHIRRSFFLKIPTDALAEVPTIPQDPSKSITASSSKNYLSQMCSYTLPSFIDRGILLAQQHRVNREHHEPHKRTAPRNRKGGSQAAEVSLRSACGNLSGSYAIEVVTVEIRLTGGRFHKNGDQAIYSSSIGGEDRSWRTLYQ